MIAWKLTQYFFTYNSKAKNCYGLELPSELVTHLGSLCALENTEDHIYVLQISCLASKTTSKLCSVISSNLLPPSHSQPLYTQHLKFHN